MENTLEFDEKHGVLVMKIPARWEPARFNEGEAEEFISLMEELYGDSEHRYLVVDISRTQKTGISKEFRRWMTEKAARIGLDKVAVVGASPVTRMVSKVVMAALGKSDDTRFFISTNEALVWFANINAMERKREAHSML